MGWDITCWAERYHDGAWHPCLTDAPHRGPGLLGFLEFYPSDTRDRALFAILAGVYGYGFKPICPPRGLPTDSNWLAEMKPEALEEIRQREFATWYLAQELLDFDWYGNRRRLRGYVNGPEFEHYLIDGARYSLADEFDSFRQREAVLQSRWAKAGKPPASRIVTNSQMVVHLDEGDDTFDLWTSIEAKDGGPYAAYAEIFVDESLPLLANLGDPSKTRIVMWIN